MENKSTVSVSRESIKDIMEISNHLQGEEAVEQIIRFFDCPKDSMTGDLALKSVVRFYSNVRYLQEIIQIAFKAN